jgi:hypothetical protein
MAVKMQDVIRQLGYNGEFIQLRGQSLDAATSNGGFAIYIGPP